MVATQYNYVNSLYYNQGKFMVEYMDGSEQEVPWNEHVKILQAGLDSLTGSIDHETYLGLVWIRDYLIETTPDNVGLPVAAMGMLESLIMKGEMNVQDSP